MKIRDLIRLMSDNTEILVYHETEHCAMPAYGDCKGGMLDYSYDCMDCSCYVEETSEWTEYHGSAGDCPIKLAERTVVEINNAYHEIEVYVTRRKKKTEPHHMIAIKVKERGEEE